MIKYEFFDQLRIKIKTLKDSIVEKRGKWISSNSYYYRQFLNSVKYIIPERSSVLNIGCSTGYILNQLNPARGVGVESSPEQIKYASEKYPDLEFFDMEVENVEIDGTFDYILISGIEDMVDIKSVLDSIKKNCHRHTRIIISHYSYLWQPLVSLAEKAKIRLPQAVHNWFSNNDVKNMFNLSDYNVIHTKKLILFPFYIPLISYMLNKYLARLPLLRHLTMSRLTIAYPRQHETREYSVSVVIPCRNEAGNIQDAVERIPELGSHTEIVFCDDKSTDKTADNVRKMQKKYPDKDIKLVEGPGICKAENVWTGFDAASGEILMILDADLTVIPEELPYFYEAIARGYGEFINGSRLVYPMHDDAMRGFNIIGNKFFSIFFTYILDSSIKDTLCGTKVMWAKDFEKIKVLRGRWGIKDRWGDYELIFGAAKNHLKIIDLPVHYMERTYGETKMTNRFKNGWIMLKMSMASLFKIKFH